VILDKVTLEGKRVRLEPLAEKHHDGLCKAINDGELWKLFVTLVPPVEGIPSFIKQAEKDHQAGLGLAFAIIDKQTNQIAGSTRLMKASWPNKRIEIGYTFLGQSWHRTGVNIETKLLMLTYVFEELDLNRVELLTDYFNKSSRNAILGLGAKEEGILRNHMVMPDGRVRDSVIYSIIKNEWLGVKQHLNNRLMQKGK
jgi:RimJ/RimL family protein N-acetyltransferase